MARKKKVEEKKSDLFTVMFLSLSIILLAFFILLNSIAVIDSSQSRKALASLIGTFGVSGGGQLFKFGITRLSEDETQEVIDKWMKKWDKLAKSQLHIEIERLMKELTNEDDPQSPLTRRDGQDLAITFPSDILFEEGSTKISKEAKKVLDLIAKKTAEFQTQVSVEGHTDPFSENTDDGINPWELSAYRAAAVGRYLLSTKQLKPMDMTLKGRAGAKPLPGGDTPILRKRNRRVVIVMQKVDELSERKGGFWKGYGLRDPFAQSKPPDEDVDF
jgi:chemotaxis protein MotB